MSGDDRPSLVFAHYFGGSERSWLPLLGALGGDFACVVPTLPGFGGASPLPGEPSLDGYAEWFTALAPPQPWIAVGHSMGGKVALTAALRRSPGLAALVLITTSPPFPEPMTDEDRRTTLAAFGSRAAAEANFHEITSGRLSPGILAACVEDQLRVDRSVWLWWYERGNRDDVSRATATLTLPALVLTGDDDKVMGPDTAPAVAAGLQNARLETMACGGHLLPLEQPDAVAASIRAFAGALQ